MKSNFDLNPLNAVERVEVPPFLLTRIHARLESLQSIRVKPVYIYSTLLALALLFMLNVGAMMSFRQHPKVGNERIGQEMGFVNSNQLYHDQD